MPLDSASAKDIREADLRLLGLVYVHRRKGQALAGIGSNPLAT
jgi:hypothetical protein